MNKAMVMRYAIGSNLVDGKDAQRLRSSGRGSPMNDWGGALLATARRMDVKDIEKAQKAARVALRRAAKVKRDPLKDELKALSDALNRDIATSNARIAAEFSTLRQTQAEEKVLAFAIGAHDKRGNQ